MSIEDQMIRQRDFSAGEINPDAIRRDDMELLKYAVRYARNMASTHTGGIIRRPGRRKLFEDTGVIMDFKPFDDIAYTVVFIAGGVRVRTEDGALVASLSAPWGADEIDSLVFEPAGHEIFVCWSGRPLVISVSPGTNMWSIGAIAFKTTGLFGAQRLPFYRFSETLGITLQPSARVGDVNITFSAGVLLPAHVGAYFRYGERQIVIRSVSSPTTGVAGCIEQLPPTYNFTVASSSGFVVGEIIETETTNIRMEVLAVTPTVITAVAIGKLTTPTGGEKLVGPSAVVAISSFAETTPGATVQWDEQFMSDVRGWPRSVSKDRQRLIFANFRSLKNAALWSAVGDNRDFLIGADPDDAILETIDVECQLYHIAGGYDEFAVTDIGIFYIPISVGTPLQPGSVEFRPIFSNEIANIRPIQVTEGLIFVDKARTGVYAISATGQTARPYIANEVNRVHRHLFGGVKSISVSSGTSIFPSRQIYAVNADGSVVVGQFNPDREYIGWLRWEGDGAVKSISGSYGNVVCMSVYDFDGIDYGVAEALDYDLLCDCATTFSGNSSSDFLQLNNGEPLLLNDGSKLTLNGIVTSFYGGKTVEVFAGGFYFGEVTVPANGIITGYGEYGEVTVGVGFGWELHPLFTNFEGGQPVGQGEQKRKIEKMLATVRGTQEFQIGNRIYGSYRGGEDMSLPVPMRDDTYKYRETGRSYDPDVPFASTFPCKFKLIELATRITV